MTHKGYYIKFQIKQHRGIIDCVDGPYDTLNDAQKTALSIAHSQKIIGGMNIFHVGEQL